jgi:hypothetical protein
LATVRLFEMDRILGIMAALIAQPLLALLPAGVLLVLFALSRARLILVSSLLWLAYLPYEYAMKLRLLCAGECNIRVDLLAIYPVLLLASLASVVVFVMRRKR